MTNNFFNTNLRFVNLMSNQLSTSVFKSTLLMVNNIKKLLPLNIPRISSLGYILNFIFFYCLSLTFYMACLQL